MYRVQFRDAANPSRILVGTFNLPYDPPNGSRIRHRRRGKDTKHVEYRVIDHIYEAVEEDAHESGFALLVQQIG